MSQQELINLIRRELDGDSDTSTQRTREARTANKGNEVFAQNVGKPIFEYLDTIYWDRIVKYVESQIAPVRATAIQALSLPAQIPGPPGPAGPAGVAGAPGHVDTIEIPHADTISHTDTTIPHTDTPAHDDTTTPHTDIPHNDTPAHDDTTTPHTDIPHNDTYITPHSDTTIGSGTNNGRTFGGGVRSHLDAYGQDNNTFI